nr:Maff2 family protein [Butyricicoccus sp. GAM44]
MPDLSDTRAKCRIGTAEFFTFLLLLYHTSAKSQGMKQLMAGGGVALIGTTLVPLLSGLFG